MDHRYIFQHAFIRGGYSMLECFGGTYGLWHSLSLLLFILWFLSNLSLIVLVLLNRQSEFLLHHQYNLQLISICERCSVPFGFLSVFINNKKKNLSLLWVLGCLFFLDIRLRLADERFHSSLFVLENVNRPPHPLCAACPEYCPDGLLCV